MPDIGAHASNGGSISLTGVTIGETTGTWGFGLLADNGSISMTGGSITATRSYGGGIQASSGGNITLTNVGITAGSSCGINVKGIFSTNGGAVTMSGGGITTYGADSYGAVADGGLVTLKNNVAVIANGNSAAGLDAAGLSGAARIDMEGGGITTYGAFGYGVLSEGASYSGVVTLANAAIVTNGASAHGLYAIAHGSITMTGGSIQTTDASSCGAYAGYGAIRLNDTLIQSAGRALYARGADSANKGTIVATVGGQSVTGGAYLLYADQYSSIDLTANSGGNLSGAAYVSGTGGTANVTLNRGAAWTNIGDSSLTNLTLGRGAVRFAATSAGAYHSLTINHALTGSGVFYLNSNLASGLADCLVVGGTASGSYKLVVSNAGGAVNSNTAVKVVDIASGAGGSATYSGGTDVGACRYSIARGSALSSYSGVSSLEDYYYYNSFGPSTPAQAAIDENAGTVVAWYGELNEIKKRLGDLRMGTQSSDDLWVRTYADKYNVRPGGGNAYSQIMRGMEIGKDNPQSCKDGKKYTGFLLGYGQADNTYSDGGSGTTDSNYVGAYASWLKDNGAYLDLIGKYNWLRHDFTTPVLGGTEDSGLYRNQALGLSVELGKHIEPGNGVFIEAARTGLAVVERGLLHHDAGPGGRRAFSKVAAAQDRLRGWAKADRPGRGQPAVLRQGFLSQRVRRRQHDKSGHGLL